MSDGQTTSAVLGALRAVAPVLGGVLGSMVAPGVGTAAGAAISSAAVDFLSTKLGVQDKSAPALVQAVSSLPTSDLLKLELEFRQHCDDNNLKYAELEVTDRDSARKREIATQDKTVGRLAWTIIGGFFVISLAQLIALMGYPEKVAEIPSQGWLLIGNISGYLAAEAKQAAAYYFGSSSGSKSKDDTIATIAKNGYH